MVSARAQVMASLAELKDPRLIAEIGAEIDPISWMEYVGLHNEKGEPIEFTDHKPLLQVYRDLHPRQANQKGSQIGMTQLTINKLLWFGDNNNVTVIYTMPTQKDIYKFSQSRFGVLIKDNDYLRSRMKGSVDNAELKRIGHSWIHFRGAQKETQAISVPADILVHDEYDFSDPDILDTFGKRLGASRYKWVWSFSTPTIPRYGINAQYLDSDQYHWLIKCERCNTWQDIDFFKNTFKKRNGTRFFGCHKCGKPLKRRSGQWIAMQPSKATDPVYDRRGNLSSPGTGTRGYWINPLTFTYITAQQKWDDYKRAEKSQRPSKVKNFYNFDLGIPYVSGESLITEETILGPMSVLYTDDGYNVMGIDQGDILHWVIKHIGPNGKMPVIKFGKTENFDDIARLFVEWGCRAGVIDALPNKHPARQLVQKMGHKFWMAYYKDQNPEMRQATEGKHDKDEPHSKSHKETQTVLIDRVESLDMSGKAWVDGRSYLLADKEHLGPAVQEFIDQMQNMKRDLRENAKGIEVPAWVRTGDDHYRHADNYAHVASMLAPRRGSIADISVGGRIPSMNEGVHIDLAMPTPLTLAGNPNFRDW